MIIWPKKWNAKVPSSLVGIIVAVAVSLVIKTDVATVGEIPRTLLPSVRLNLGELSVEQMTNLISPAIVIAALGMIESLLCGASAGRMKGEIHSALVEEINEHDSSLVTGRLSNNTIVHFPGDESLIGKIVDCDRGVEVVHLFELPYPYVRNQLYPLSLGWLFLWQHIEPFGSR